ncbi:PACRG-like protein [Saccoglossus kowalevskii]|uniref:PACRG-like protein-like n=1 Tax=Saccoglossus kowalevskii TaxID=10224 RepID=A0ABM0GUZ7_SACKO|nr:PREDICTED: PACRG-like protein-like [Saccoglossus kowalevskii]
MTSFGPPRASSGGSKSRSSSAGSTSSTGSKPSSAGSSGRPVKTRPSDRLNPKTIDPFNERGPKSAFATVYANGGVPCRLVHGSVKHKLHWDIPVEEVAYDPVLITLTEGLRETKHPYIFVAQMGFKELLEVYESSEKILPVLPKIIAPLRAALSHSDGQVFEGSLNSVVQLSAAAGAHLNPHLKQLLGCMSKRSMEKKYKDKVATALQQIEQSCGRESLPIIKAKVPTYSSIFT